MVDDKNQPLYDLLIIGGGVNGVGIARDAVGRGLKVILVEKGDLAGATSSAATKLIHGGLRYLEHYEFRLVREALIERETLLRMAPHIIWPLRFVLPHASDLRPAWMIRLGLFLYDHLGGRKLLPGSTGVDLRKSPVGAPLKSGWKKGFIYSDCWVDDARLVALNARDAADRGAKILTRTEFLKAERVGQHWTGTVKGEQGEEKITAKAIVNAAGPWVAAILHDRIARPNKHNIRLVKGSHIIVPQLFSHSASYIFQQPDRRIVFAIPYESKFTLIGTTDLEVKSAEKPKISPEETDYLCAAVNRYFNKQISPADVVWSYAGVRPLQDDESGNASKVTRDYTFDLDAPNGQAPLLSIFGGKLTTYRKLAEHAMEKLAPLLGVSDKGWTAGTSLPGGDIADADFAGFVAKIEQRYAGMPKPLLHRLCRLYGTRIDMVLGSAKGFNDLGADLGAGLTEAELTYLVRQEWAQTAEDVLWRRTKLGLVAPPGTAERITEALRHIRK